MDALELRPILIATAMLVVLGILGTFPTFFQAFASEWRVGEALRPAMYPGSSRTGYVKARIRVGWFPDSVWPPAADYSRDPEEERTMRPRLFALLAAIAVLVAAAGVFTLARGGRAVDKSPTSVSEHAAAVPASARTVAVSRTMPMPSARERRLSAMLEAGAMPDRPVMAEVMTDTNCAPDAEMISRCRNVMRLANGRQIVLRHPHDMTQIPCLAPGERVWVIPTGV